MEVDTTSQRLQASNNLNNFCTISVKMEEELSSAEMQAAVRNNYGKLQFAFNNFKTIL